MGRLQSLKKLRAGVALLSLAAVSCGGGGGESGSSTPSPSPAPNPLGLNSPQSTANFLNMTSFGANLDDVTRNQGRSASQVLSSEFSKSPTFVLPGMLDRQAGGEEIPGSQFSREYWSTMITADDQLRQRMVFALSQILVVADERSTLGAAHYHDILARNAFGNYRDLLLEVTYSSRMGDWLTYIRNRGDREDQGRMPDENYAREFLQLFTIGLVQLNMDGSVVDGAGGRPVEVYDNEDIVGLSRVFTGLSKKGETFWRADDDGDYVPMVMFEQFHSPHDKAFLDFTIPAGTLGDESIAQAIDHIFSHPNVAPFISRQLIQRFTSSNPTPAYVERVAEAFEAGRYRAEDGVSFGTGERGDLAATLAAILLDQDLFDGQVGTNEGKIKEPILRFVQMVRAFNYTNIDPTNDNWLRNSASATTRLGQHPFRSPSVFNFYRPGYIAPGTETGNAELTAPELQITNSGSMFGYTNFMTGFAIERTSRRDRDNESFKPDYSTELSLADDPQELVDHLDMLLTGGHMLDETKAGIVSAVSDLPLDLTSSDAEAIAEDRLTRVELAVSMAVTAPSYFIQF